MCEKDDCIISRTVAGETYTLPAHLPVDSVNKRCFKWAVKIAAFPLAIPFGALYAMCMAIPPLRDTILGMFLPIGMRALDRKLKVPRERLLKNVSGRVLDVGSGGGAYLQYCQAAKIVVAVEPVVHLHSFIRESGEGTIEKLTIVQDLNELKDEKHSFDWVILGNVLCEVPSVKETIQQIDHLLRPGGKVFFSEHVAAKQSWQRRVQHWMNPIWRLLFGGCNCNRDSILCLEKTTDWEVISWVYYDLKVLFGPFVIGLAVKPKKAVESKWEE